MDSTQGTGRHKWRIVSCKKEETFVERVPDARDCEEVRKSVCRVDHRAPKLAALFGLARSTKQIALESTPSTIFTHDGRILEMPKVEVEAWSKRGMTREGENGLHELVINTLRNLWDCAKPPHPVMTAAVHRMDFTCCHKSSYRVVDGGAEATRKVMVKQLDQRWR